MSHAFGTAIYTGRVKLPGDAQQEARQVQHADCALEAMIQTVTVGPRGQTHLLGYDHRMTLHS
jgi:ssRNA-specific RNase YbeY (16S rRNA maturation enzyme)